MSDGKTARDPVVVERSDLLMALNYIGDDDNGWDSRTAPEWFVSLAFAEHLSAPASTQPAPEDSGT